MNRYSKDETIKTFLTQNKATIIYDGMYKLVFDDGGVMITTKTSDEMFSFLIGYKYASMNYEKILERINTEHNNMVKQYDEQMNIMSSMVEDKEEN